MAEKPRDPAPKRRKARALTTAEASLWRHVTRDVTPLSEEKAAVLEDLEAALESGDPQPSLAVAPEMPKPQARSRQAQSPRLDVGVAAGVDKRTAQRLRRGKMAVEARMDLHGHTVAEAHRALNSFLAASQAAGRRCVLVITGKGNFGGGKIRAEIPDWLNEPANRQRVISFSHAHPKDGGTGALYILLRKGGRT
ncbi:MAG: Smr/MutS family protein [Magnetospiraceae bacterium]